MTGNLTSGECDNEFQSAAEFLSKTGWLSSLPEGQRKLVLRRCDLVRFHADETIYSIGDKADGLYGFVTAGVRVMVSSEAGETALIHATEPGFWIGDAALLPDRPRMATLIATKETTGLHLSRFNFEALLSKHPELTQAIHELGYRNLLNVTKLLAHLTDSNVERRIIMRLLHYDEILEEPGSWLTMSQAEIAELVGASRTTMNLLVKKLEKAKAIEHRYGKLRVINRKALFMA